MYRERTDRWSKCLLPNEVKSALFELHDCHRHFAGRITLGRAIGRYFWPHRWESIVEYCKACPECQIMGPRLPKQKPLSVLVLQPMDLFALDYMGPITPVTPWGNHYILIGGDYFSRYMVARALLEATACRSWLFVRDDVSQHFGWPRAMYTDNGSHFTGQDFVGPLTAHGTKRIPAAVKAPWSVGFAERLVRLILAALRRMAVTNQAWIRNWDLLVGAATQMINTRAITPHGFTPAEVLLGFRPRYREAPASVED